MSKVANVKLHGILGDQVGRSEWRLAVTSVGEAMRAIEIMSKRKLFKSLNDNDKKQIKYRILINGRDFESEKPLDDPNDIESIKNSELNINFKNLDTVDIIPLLEGSGGGKGASIGAIVVGVILIIVGALVIYFSGGSATPLGSAIITAGVGLIVGGVINLLTKPPKIDDFRELKGGGRPSYLFSGPQNTTREGGPVPVGYGRMIVGSQVIAASYEISHANADYSPLTS